MKDNTNVTNDIFQNDNNKNKTKTILLLTIVAVILIAVFLIIAWVMTRDNSLQVASKAVDNNNDIIVSQSPNNDFQPQIQQDPFNLNLPPAPPSSNKPVIPNNTISNTPPSNVSNEPNLGALSNAINNSIPDSKTNYENDPKFQENLKAIEQKHADKNADKNQKPDEKGDKKDTKITTQPPRVVTPPPPRETVIAQAPDPTRQTKPSTPKSDDKGKNDNKGNNAKDSKNDKGTNKTEPKKQEGKDNKDNKDNKPKADSKPDSKDDNVIHRPVRPVLKDQGKEAAKGHYIQVGIFSKDSKIDPIFLNNISKYSYRIKAVDGDKVRYLIGPYNSKTDANRELQTIRTEINSGAFYFLVN